MKIFISVAGPDRSKVEEVVLALRDEDHHVFLDEHGLPPGSSYHRRIREAVMQADLAVFFISPLSVQADRYTLSELNLMQERWPHPRGRVLPVMIGPTDLNKVPAYLKAVTICKPKGNIAADVAYEVSRMRDEIRRAGGHHGEGSRARAQMTGGMALEGLAAGGIAAFGLSILAALATVLVGQLATPLGLSWLSHVVFYGVSLALTVWLAALLFGIRDPIIFGVLAAGSIAAYWFESQSNTALPVPALFAGKSAIIALFAAAALPGFRSPLSWASLTGVGLMAGLLAASQRFLENFVWEALLVATVTILLALTEPRVVRAG